MDQEQAIKILMSKALNEVEKIDILQGFGYTLESILELAMDVGFIMDRLSK